MAAASVSRLLALASLGIVRSRTLRLMTFNIHGWRDAEHVDNLQRLIDVINEERPDVVCLNEALHPFIAPDPSDSYWSAVRERRGHGHRPPEGTRPDPADERNYLHRLAAALGLPHCVFGAAVGEGVEPEPLPLPFEGSFFGQYPFGNAILSRFPLADVRRTLLRVTPEDLDLGNQARTTADLEHRQCTSALVQLPDGGCVGVCVSHLDHKAEELRARQIRQVIDHCHAAFGTAWPSVLVGDLNSFDQSDMDDDGWASIVALYARRGWPPPRPASLVRAALDAAGYADAFALAASAPAPVGTDTAAPPATERPHDAYDASSASSSAAGGTTLHAISRPPVTCWTQTRLDYVLLSPVASGGGPAGLRVRSHRTLQCDASDHLPIVCELELPKHAEGVTEK